MNTFRAVQARFVASATDLDTGYIIGHKEYRSVYIVQGEVSYVSPWHDCLCNGPLTCDCKRVAARQIVPPSASR